MLLGAGSDELGLVSILVYTLVGIVELLMQVLGYNAIAGLDALDASIRYNMATGMASM